MMTEEQIEDKILAFRANELGENERKEVISMLNEDNQWKAIYEDFYKIDALFEEPIQVEVPQALDRKMEELFSTKAKSAWYKNQWIWIISVLLISFSILFYYQTKNHQQIKTQFYALNDQLNQLKTQEGTAVERVSAVNYSSHNEKLDDEVLSLLIHALQHDPSSNVRLSALEALQDHLSNEKVRQTIYSAMSREKDAMVLINYVHTLQRFQEPAAINVLKDITQDESVERFIKDEAYKSLLKLEQY